MLSPPRATQSPDCSWVRIQHPLSRRPPASQVSYFPRGSSSKVAGPWGRIYPAPKGSIWLPPFLCSLSSATPPLTPVLHTHTHTTCKEPETQLGVGGRGATQLSPPVGRTLWVFTGASARRLGGWLTWAPRAPSLQVSPEEDEAHRLCPQTPDHWRHTELRAGRQVHAVPLHSTPS